MIFAHKYFKVNVTPVEALWQQPLVVESKESRESENDDDEADGDDDDDDVVRLFDNSSGAFAFVAGQSARGAQVFRVLRRVGEMLRELKEREKGGGLNGENATLGRMVKSVEKHGRNEKGVMVKSRRRKTG